MGSFGLTQVICVATRSTAECKSLLDHVYVSCTTLVPKHDVIAPLGSSDHSSLMLSLSLSKPPPQRLPSHMVWLYCKADFDAINEELSASLPEPDCSDARDVDELWSHFKSGVFKRFVPRKRVSCRKSLPWVTGDVRRCLRQRDKAHRAARKAGSSERWAVFHALRASGKE